MNRVSFTILIAVLSLTAISCSHASADMVYAIPKTKTYHKSSCPPVGMAKTVVMPQSDAEKLHYSPCPAFEVHH